MAQDQHDKASSIQRQRREQLVIGGCAVGLCPCRRGQRQLGASNNDLLWNDYFGQGRWSKGNGTVVTEHM